MPRQTSGEVVHPAEVQLVQCVQRLPMAGCSF
jgi:hypothetical protein